MMDKYTEIKIELNRAENEARAVIRAVDSACNGMAGLLTGRLRSVPSWRLKELKKELRDFNMHTGVWKSFGEKL